jgi:HD-GYP domain-containing protein (c-di-GMP phosphodiesterase class II)
MDYQSPVVETPERQSRAGRTVLLLLVLFFAGLASIILIDEMTNRLLLQLDRKAANQRARLFIAEDISRTVTTLELDFLRMATSTNLHRQKMIQSQITEHLARVRNALEVLQKGGDFDQKITLNLEGLDAMNRSVQYRPDPDDTTNLLAAIELEPHLDLIHAKSALAMEKLVVREKARDSGDIKRLSAAELNTKLFFKETSSLFVRLHENTNRLFHESTVQMKALTLAHDSQRTYYRNVQALLVGLVLLLVLGLGGVLGRQISNMTGRLHRSNMDLQSANQAAQSALSLSREAEYEICLRLGRAAEFRDLETGQHTRRISEMAAVLASLAGFSHEMTELLRFASPLHDVGKVGIPDQILLKPGKLDDHEMQTIRLHTVLGDKLLAEAGQFPALELGRVIALQHHEKWDGSGYPKGLQGEEIAIVARIVTIVDIFDALLSERPYKKPFSLENAVDIMEEGRGSFFDPRLLQLFLDHLQQFVAIRNRLRDQAQDLELARQLLPCMKERCSA